MVKSLILAEPKKIYNEMLKDIRAAKKYIYLETYIYSKDSIGKSFCDALTQKAKQGVQVRLLLDAWGSTAKKKYFKRLIEAGGEVKYFREFRYVVRAFNKNHERNHRKLLIIDNRISYVGSANITSSCLKWRELVIRLRGSISAVLSKSFKHNWRSSNHFAEEKLQELLHHSFEILQDLPSPFHKKTEKRYIKLIKEAKKSICIITPYFIPSLGIRRAFAKAAKNGVKIKIIIPYVSDVRIIDIVRNRYLGNLCKKGLEFHYYKPGTLHSKLLIVDEELFILGSSNLDYRSFLHQYELNILGKDKKIISSLVSYFNQTLKKTKPFSHSEWKSRSSFVKMLEKIIARIIRYL